jgi:hypothetical protein
MGEHLDADASGVAGANGRADTSSTPSQTTSPVNASAGEQTNPADAGDGGPEATQRGPSATPPNTERAASEPPSASSSGKGPDRTSGAGALLTPRKLAASIHEVGPAEDREALYGLVVKLQDLLKIQVWMFVQNESCDPQFRIITEELGDSICGDRELRALDRVAFLIHSPGGIADPAYRIGACLARRKEGFVAIVPRYAKSAATLMSLGAQTIVLGRQGELGPLDAQITDTDREQVMSALDAVQSLERLHKFALDSLDSTTTFLRGRTRKKFDRLLPVATRFVNEMVRPLFESIDVYSYTQLSRTLKVAEDYAVRLLTPTLGNKRAEQVANTLISAYPEHGFVIDFEEAKRIGLPAVAAAAPIADLLDEMLPYLETVVAVGRLKEVEDAVDNSEEEES